MTTAGSRDNTRVVAVVVGVNAVGTIWWQDGVERCVVWSRVSPASVLGLRQASAHSGGWIVELRTRRIDVSTRGTTRWNQDRVVRVGHVADVSYEVGVDLTLATRSDDFTGGDGV